MVDGLGGRCSEDFLCIAIQSKVNVGKLSTYASLEFRSYVFVVSASASCPVVPGAGSIYQRHQNAVS